jgi:hypothetical protein
VSELELMRDNLNSQQTPHVQVIVGMGGIGKTELATEYIHNNRDDYEIIWWIRAEHHDRVRDALVKLAQRLGLREAATDSDRDRTITAVLRVLQSEAQSSWLLVYDNVVNPLELQKYLPASRPGGHVIITSRQLNWPSYVFADGVELQPFTEEEAVSFLRGKVPGLAVRDGRKQLTQEEDARRESKALWLAAELGHLPIAIDHAAAYLAETKLSVDEYITRFAENAHQLLSEQPGDPDLPAHISGTWAMSTTLLTPDAEHLFNLCAFFSPEPIAANLFLQDTTGIDHPPGVGAFLSSPQRFRAASSQLHRLSLAKVDGARDLIQMHRVVQAVTQGRLRQDRREMLMHTAPPSRCCWLVRALVTRITAAVTRPTICLFSISNPIGGSCTPVTRHCAISSSTRYGAYGCAAPMSRRCNSVKMRCEYGGNASARMICRC